MAVLYQLAGNGFEYDVGQKQMGDAILLNVGDDLFGIFAAFGTDEAQGIAKAKGREDFLETYIET